MCLQNSFKSKAEAVKYALESTYKLEDKQISHQYDKAQKLFDFITKNVNLPDVAKDPIEELSPIINSIVDKIDKLKDERNSMGFGIAPI